METSSDAKKIGRPDPKAGVRDILLFPDLNQAVAVIQKEPNKDIASDTNIPKTEKFLKRVQKTLLDI